MSYVYKNLESVLHSLKTGTRQVIRDIGNLDSAAYEVRVSAAMLSQYCDGNKLDKFMPIDVLMQLEKTGEGIPHVTKYMADHHGYLLIKKPENPPRDINLHNISDLVKEFGEFLAVSNKAINHEGRISADEVVRYDIERETQDVIDQLLGIKQRLTQIREAGE